MADAEDYFQLMNEDQAALCLEALGHPKRLAIFRLLVKAGDDGANVGQVREALDIPGSTLTHHLTWLARTGLVTQERLGREIRCRADYERIDAVLGFLKEECCSGLIGEKDAAA